MPPTETFSERVAEQVRRELAAKKLPASVLAPVLDIGVQAAQRRVSGETPFGLDEVPLVAAFLEVPISRLLSAMADAA